MNRRQYIALLGTLLMLWFPQISSALPAFPGAEGFGSDTVGGRGGKVIKVTNLNDSGSGSLRAAVEASGPRIVVFDVSGVINLNSDILLDKPYITIAGQTSPGGILITGRRFKVNTHDVVLRYLRFRVGSHGGLDPEKNRSLEIYGDGAYYPNKGYNIVVDHCSFSWAADQVVSVGEDAYDVTISWSIISEGLDAAGHPDGGHSYAILYWGKHTEDSRKYSFHHNYLAHNGGRVPEINFAGILDSVNNVIYNYTGGKSPKTSGNAKANWIHNYVKPGYNSNSPSAHFEARHDLGGKVGPNIYTMGNIGVKRVDQSNPEQWYIGESWRSKMLSQDWRSFTEVVPSVVTDTVMTEEYAREILQTVGASKPSRDSVDARVIADFAAGTGRIIDNVSYPKDFPGFASPSAPVDKDNDGMADSWEQQNGLITSIDDSALDANGNGYTNIEEYLHYLSGVNYMQPKPPMPPANVGVELQQ